MTAVPEIKVLIGTLAKAPAIPGDSFEISHPANGVSVITPLSCGTLFPLDDVEIGINFHWQRRKRFLLPGKIEVVDLPEGGVKVYNILPVEEYLKSVISSEMNPDAPEEFLKAHAIISRSWVMGKRGSRNHAGKSCHTTRGDDVTIFEDHTDHDDCDVCADDHCQRYQGAEAVSDKIEAIVEATGGSVLTDSRGKLVDARFSKCCGGKTEIFSTCWGDTDFDYLQSIDCPHCNLADIPLPERQSFLKTILKDYDLQTTPDFLHWQTEVSLPELSEEILNRHGCTIGDITSISALETGPSGRIKRLAIEGTHGRFTIGKELAIRRLMSPDCLYSSAFTTEINGNRAILHGRGWGHGVGLCQIGAARMARDGADFKTILDFYYPNTIITDVEKIL